MGAILSTVFALILVIGIILGVYWLIKRMPLQGRFSTGSYLRIVDRLMLTTDQSLLIVEVKDNYYLLGASSHGINLLDRLEGDFPSASSMESVFGHFLEKSKKEKNFEERELWQNGGNKK